MRIRNRLSARFVATVTGVGRHADGGNLYLSVSANGGKRWVFLYRWNGKSIEMGLGPARDVSLARAREKASSARAELADGRNPIEVSRQVRAVPTFGEAADALIEAMRPSWKSEKHAAQWKMTLTEYAAPIRAIGVDAITTEDVLGVLRPIWHSKPETASRLRGRIEAVLDAARAKGHRKNENCARWRGHLDKLLPPAKKLLRGHHAAMPYSQLPTFVKALRQVPTISNLALEFTILSAARSGEVLGATWPEIDWSARLWTVPAERMKAGRQHQVPLSSRMIEVLETVERIHGKGGGYIFAGETAGKRLSSMALTMAMRRMGASQFTPHGMRSAFRDWAGDETDFARETVEMALAHMVKDATEAAYRRSTALEKRRRLLIAWDAFLSSEAEHRVILITARRASCA
jgi:integrase